jgi:hypothetical protein
MVSERQRIEGAPPPAVESSMPPPPAYEEGNGIFMRNPSVAELVETVEYFLAEVTSSQHKFAGFLTLCFTFDYHVMYGYFLWQAIQSYCAENETELNLSAGDYIVVRKVVVQSP